MSPSLRAPAHNYATFHPSRPYYRILGLPEPPPTPTGRYAAPDEKQVKAAYRAALLRAHPDKHPEKRSRDGDGGEREGKGKGAGQDRARHTNDGTTTDDDGRKDRGRWDAAFTIDDVREAYSVLGVPERRSAYDEWLGRQRVSRAEGGEEFVLGLEAWDLADFLEGTQTQMEMERGSETGTGTQTGAEAGSETVWTHACRCGSAPGFLIREAALEEALGRGESEVLVGCGGCSLWVRVGFGVVEGEEG